MKKIRPVAFWAPVILFLGACVYNFADQEGFVNMVNKANS